MKGEWNGEWISTSGHGKNSKERWIGCIERVTSGLETGRWRRHSTIWGGAAGGGGRFSPSDALDRAEDRARLRFFPGIIRRRRMTPGLKVPSWWLPAQRTNWNDGEAVAKFHREIDTFLQHVGPTHNHPIFGKLDAKEWEELILIHSAHHLSFLVPRE